MSDHSTTSSPIKEIRTIGNNLFVTVRGSTHIQSMYFKKGMALKQILNYSNYFGFADQM